MKTRVRRATARVLDSMLKTTVVRGFGFIAYCDCGWESRVVKTCREARAESRAHRVAIHEQTRLSLSGPL